MDCGSCPLNDHRANAFVTYLRYDQYRANFICLACGPLGRDSHEQVSELFSTLDDSVWS